MLSHLRAQGVGAVRRDFPVVREQFLGRASFSAYCKEEGRHEVGVDECGPQLDGLLESLDPFGMATQRELSHAKMCVGRGLVGPVPEGSEELSLRIPPSTDLRVGVTELATRVRVIRRET